MKLISSRRSADILRIFEKYIKRWIAIAVPFQGTFIWPPNYGHANNLGTFWVPTGAPGHITFIFSNGASFVEGCWSWKICNGINSDSYYELLLCWVCYSGELC